MDKMYSKLSAAIEPINNAYDTLYQSKEAREIVSNDELNKIYDALVILERIEVRLKNHNL